MDHLHLDQRSLGESFHQIRGVPESLQQEFPDRLTELARLLVVLPDGSTEIFFGEVGPDVGAVEA